MSTNSNYKPSDHVGIYPDIFAYRRYKKNIDKLIRAAHKDVPLDQDYVGLFWSAVDAGGFLPGIPDLVKDQVRLLAYWIHREISNVERRPNITSLDLIDAWRKYLAGLFTKGKFAMNGALRTLKKIFYESPDYFTSLRLFTKNTRLKEGLADLDADALWARFRSEYGDAYQVFEKLCVYVGFQFDQKVKDINTAFQLYDGGDRQPQDDQLLETLKTLIHYRNAIFHGHAEVSASEIRLWDGPDNNKWWAVISPVDSAKLFEPFVSMMGLLHGLEMTALELQLQFDGSLLRNMV
jgi:hypothetical protein